ncbi:glycosyltransferase [Aliivibrio finisterrensis]|uniref:glycosyltransferase n=1 Tax=Aliivibrio finisterrensis TaxID=511998 RepID=UPI00101F9D89|nr:glycosyltransferase [Aliivibrio finisterrensis]RYU48809.1 glycosyltransferase [Aliivibrio finisterrensis]RYU53549.1 glycosyltransferase [Aliivibrio finisterrensis]RYU79087.1 glycosyltransferase [Aliivibrio finisterrensis]
MKPKATLIIAFYNNITCLKLIFKALSQQSEMDFEVIIADYGSKQEAVDFITQSKDIVPFSLDHVWHEDKGFRKNRILNHAVIKSKSDYLIIIDGDCIPQKYFIEDHIMNAERGRSLTGRRVELAEKFNDLVLCSDYPETVFEDNKWSILMHYIFTRGDDRLKGRHVECGLRFPQAWQQYLLNGKNHKAILGCNFSLYKEDLLKVNGFDMRYEAPATGEDTDVDYRLNLVGVTNKSLRYLGNQIHMYHPLLTRDTPNHLIFEDVVKKQAFWAEDGISKLL